MATLSPVLKQATPVLVAPGQGVYVYDDEDPRYLDFRRASA
jgi:4-aminobutyrate aminotransferase